MLQSSFLSADGRIASRSLSRPGAFAVLISAILVAALVLAYQLYQRRFDNARLAAYRQLVAISELKAEQLESWIEERKGDASTLAAARRDRHTAGELLAAFEAYRHAYGYEEIALLDAGGALQLATAGTAPLAADEREAARQALRTRQIRIEGVRAREAGADRIRVSVIAPLPSGAGAVMLRANPRQSLFRTLQQWPLTATSGETVLVEHDGEGYAYLTDRRYAPVPAGGRSIDEAQTVLAQAVRQPGGPIEGPDYRGVPSLAAAQGVKGTDWLLISKVDAAEVYAPYRREAWLMAALIAISILGAGAGAAYWRRGQRLRLVSRQRVAEERLAAIVQSSDDAIMHVGLDGRIGAWNEGARRLYGYSAEEMIGQPLLKLVPPELKEQEAALFAGVRAGEPIANHATRRLAKDGRSVEVSVSIRPVRNAQGRIVAMAGIARDLTAQRQADAARERLARLYRALTSLNELAARAQTEQTLLEGVCEAAVGIGEFETAAVRLVDRATLLSHRVAMRGRGTEALARPLDMRADSRDKGSLAWRVYHTGRVAIASAAELAASMPGTEAEVSGASAGAYPLFRRGDCVGVLLLRSPTPDIFTGAVHELLERMADDVSHALDALAAADELRRFRVALDNSADLILIADTSTLRFVDANNTASRLLGYSRDELIGMHCTQVLPHTAEELQTAYAQLIAQPGSTGSLRSYYRCKDGSHLAFESTRHVLREGDRWLVAAISRDTRDREAAEQAARQKDRYFASLLANVSDSVAACDMDWRLVYLSPSCETLIGYRPEELLGRQFGVTIPGAEAWRDRLAAALAEGHGPQRIRLPLVRKDGEQRVQEIVVSKGRGPEGEPIYVLVGRDVTEQERREQEFATLVHHSPDVIARWDRDLRIYFVNEAVRQPTGTEPAALLGKRMAQIGGPAEFARAWDEHLRRAFDTGREESAEMSYPGATGTSHFDVRFIPERSADGTIGSVMTIARDITARFSVQQDLARRDAFFRSLVENVSDAIGAADMDWRYVYVSPSAASLYGYAPEELIGRRFAEITVADDEGVRRRLEQAMRESGAPQRLQLDVRTKDGAPRRHEVVVSRGTGPDGAPIYLFAARDITDRAYAEQRFQALIEHGADAIVVYDRDARIQYRSPSVGRLTGFADEERTGGSFTDIVLAEDLASVRDQLAAAAATPGTSQPLSCRIRHKDGSVRWLEGTLANLLHEPAVRGVVVNFRDVTERVHSQEELSRRQEQFKTLAENSPDGIARFDRNGRCEYVNGAAVASTGRPAEWFIGRTVRDQASLGFAQAFELPMQRVLETGETETVDFSYETLRGLRHYQALVAAERDAAGATASVIVMSRDVTKQKLADQRLRESESRLRAIVQATPSPLLVVSREGEVLFANPAAADLLGRQHADLPGLPLGLPLADHRPADVELVVPGGETRPAEMRFAPAFFDGRDVLIVSLHDLSERRRYEKHIEHLANHDSLTGLPNRTLLRDRVEQAIIHARRSHSHVALMFVDLDQFKLVNDSWGHAMGDALLLEVGIRLHRTVRDGDTVARLGGDEFVILLCDLASPSDISVVARKVAQALEEPLKLQGREVRVTASIGISLYPTDGHDLDSLLQCADAAMYRAKDAGRNGYQYYGAEMGAQARLRVETEAGLRQALDRGELRLHYQPQVEFSSGRIRGFEALMRWQHPEKGMVSPLSFIPVAEDSGLIVPMGQWALREACKQAAAWSAGRLGRMKVAVNLSARQFWRGGVTDAVRAALDESGLPASQLELEITESTVARDLQQVTVALEQLRRLGVTIAIDDFGTGYSSLAYLRLLPIQKLKIDRSFVKGIPDDKDATALVGEIIRLAHVLRLEVVAEGVETAGQAAFLRDAGCEAFQGFLVARPMPGDDCAPLLRERRRFQF